MCLAKCVASKLQIIKAKSDYKLSQACYEDVPHVDMQVTMIIIMVVIMLRIIINNNNDNSNNSNISNISNSNSNNNMPLSRQPGRTQKIRDRGSPTHMRQCAESLGCGNVHICVYMYIYIYIYIYTHT